MAVYVFDGCLKELVKIVKKGKYYYIYRLKKVVITLISKKIKFEFEKHYYDKTTYKPYEEKDVSSVPDVFLEDIQVWQPHLIFKEAI